MTQGGWVVSMATRDASQPPWVLCYIFHIRAPSYRASFSAVLRSQLLRNALPQF